MRVIQRPFLCCLLLLAIAGTVTHAQDTPLISGAAGFISTTNGGQTFLQPVIAPVADVPIGDRLQIETRADLRGFYRRRSGTGPYEGEFFATLEYLQVDYLAASWLTVSAGRYLTPFGIYNERLTPIWIRNLQDVPMIFPIGTRTSGSSDGAMARGVVVSAPDWKLAYTAYFSASSNAEQFTAGRAAGGRASVLFPGDRLEIGASYQRFLQKTHLNSVGVDLTWLPFHLPLDTRAEYAHSLSGYGYWIEAAYRVPQNKDRMWISNLQPVFRMQQFVRPHPLPGDALPAVDTKKADFGLNYYLPDEFRISASYARQFSAGGNRNVWNVAATYRFLFPIIPGGRK